MKKILLIVPSGKGTIASVSHNLYSAFKKSDRFDVYVVNMNYEEDDDFKFGNSFNLKRINRAGIVYKLVNFIIRIIEYVKIKRNIKPDISISTLNVCTSLNILSLGKEKKIGIFHSPLKQTRILGKYVYLINLLSYRYLYGHLDRIFCVSDEVKSDIIEYVPNVDIDNVLVVYNIHNVDKIRTQGEYILDSKYNQIFTEDVILYVGNMYSIKAPDRLIRAFAHLKKYYDKPLHLVFAGCDKFGTIDKLREIISYYNIQSSVFFLGNQPNPYKLIKRAKCLVSSSISEGLPGVLIESLLLNTPIISTNSSKGVWEILSCKEKYNKDLNELFITKNGIITPNIEHVSNKNILNFTSDDILMSKAIEIILSDSALYKSMKSNPFDFETEIGVNNLLKFDI